VDVHDINCNCAGDDDAAMPENNRPLWVAFYYKCMQRQNNCYISGVLNVRLY
jgi:hypothetical protein